MTLIVFASPVPGDILSDVSREAADNFRPRLLAALSMHGARVHARLPATADAHPTMRLSDSCTRLVHVVGVY